MILPFDFLASPRLSAPLSSWSAGEGLCKLAFGPVTFIFKLVN